MLCLTFLLLLTFFENAHATIPFFLNQKNLGSDNTVGYLINKPGSAAGDTTLDVGDRIRGMIRIESLENVSSGGATVNLVGDAQATEFTAIYDITLISKTFLFQGPNGPMYQLVFGPTPTATAWAGLPGGAPQPGTIIRFYEDPSKDYSRLLAANQVDDGDPYLTGADIGTNQDFTEESLIARATDGAPYWDLGFTGAPSAAFNGQPSPALGEGWTAFSTDQVAVLHALPAAGNGGIYNFGLNLTANFLGPALGPVATNFGGTAQMSGSGSLIGLNGFQTPFDFFSNVDFTFFPKGCSGTIGDYVWHDLNRNGIQDSGEPGIDGVILKLYLISNDLPPASTSPLGACQFGQLL